MDIKLKASLLGTVLAGAAAIGVEMGESAIADINPIYFQGEAVHPRDRGAAVADVMPAAQATSFADHYGWAEGQAARLADCIDCAALRARDQFAALPVRDQYAAIPVRYAVVETAPEPEPVRIHRPEPEPAFIVETADVDRYAYYPIEEEPEGKPVDYAFAEE
jgi:hypothetical protein